MKTTINILCATDKNYIPYCGIMITSVFENNKDSNVNIYVMIDEPLSVQEQRQFHQLESKYKQRIFFVLVDKSLVRNYPTKGMKYWSIAMYYRLFAEELLPKSIDKVLYFDCDIIVTSSLEELWQTNLTGQAVACVDDVRADYNDVPIQLGYPIEGRYFNSGVLLMNLKYWRKHKVSMQCFDYLENNYDKLYANDQDVLNAVLWNQKINIPIRFNYQMFFLSKTFYPMQAQEKKNEIWANISNPTIIHYATKSKPWHLNYNHLFLKEWKYYKRKSPWWYIFPTRPKHKLVNYLLKHYILWPLGLCGKITKATIYKELRNL